MGKAIFLGVLSVFVMYFSCTGQTTELTWNAFEIVDYQKIEVEIYGVKDSANFPVFKESTYSLENTEITIGGYYFCMESIDLNTLDSHEICILAIEREPTIVVCGRPQYRQNEFIRINGNPSFRQGKKVKLKGTIHFNKDGSNQNLISMENVTIVR